MYKIYSILILFTFIVGIIDVKADKKFPNFPPLSEKSTISILTCDPGNQLYTTFGHSAIRVKDPMQRLDIVFNYGTFNFNIPNFYVKFASGKLLYLLSFESYRQFMYMYVRESRSVIEQQLDLDLLTKQLIFDKLEENYKPENRYYQYDFFFDNCATRIIDLFYTALGDSLQYITPENNIPITFRQLLNKRLTKSDWSYTGINLLLGKVTDIPASELEKTLLPDYLHEYFKNLQIGNKPLVKKSRFILNGTFSIKKTPFFLSPTFWFWLLFSIVIFLSYKYRTNSWIVGDRTIFIIIGLIGIVVFMATFFTDHQSMRENLNLLWTHPLYIVLAGFIGSSKRKTTSLIAFMFLIMNITVLVGWQLLPQEFSLFMLPIILITTVRLAIIINKLAFEHSGYPDTK